MGCAQTGTGKTAAFAIPILTGLSDLPKPPRQTPDQSPGHRANPRTRHPNQREFSCVWKIPRTKVAGYLRRCFTTSPSQKSGVDILGNPGSGVDILVATPGRLLDLINQKLVN
jgi:ATP-dependent RNA helicase RhlE